MSPEPTPLLFPQLRTPVERQRRAELEVACQAFWAQFLRGRKKEGDEPGASATARRYLAGLTEAVEVDTLESGYVVRALELSAYPLAELLLASAPQSASVVLGRPPCGVALGCKAAEEETKVDLSEATVRIGVTRGHLLNLVLSVPLEQGTDQEQLDLAAALFAETCLGDRALDRWVISVDTVPAPRTRGLVMAVGHTGGGAKAPALTYPMSELESLFERAVTAMTDALPESLLAGPAAQAAEGADEWTALEIPPSNWGAQQDRRFASTRHPEALKSALEGLPFDSARFTRGAEVFAWIAWTASVETRQALKERCEDTIARLGLESGQLCVSGSGFGAQRDFVDLWLTPKPEVIERLLAALAFDIGHPVTLGFYDSTWESETLTRECGEAPGPAFP